MTTTPQGSRAGLELAHLASMAAVCGCLGLAWLMPVPPSPARGAIFHAVPFACATSNRTPGGHEWSAGTFDADPVDSSDDGEDISGNSDPAVSASPTCAQADLRRVSDLVHVQDDSWFFVPRESFALRGPPRLLDDAYSIDGEDSDDTDRDSSDDDDDDRDDDAEAVRAPIFVSADNHHTHLVFELQTRLCASVAADGCALRAPPQ